MGNEVTRIHVRGRHGSATGGSEEPVTVTAAGRAPGGSTTRAAVHAPYVASEIITGAVTTDDDEAGTTVRLRSIVPKTESFI